MNRNFLSLLLLISCAAVQGMNQPQPNPLVLAQSLLTTPPQNIYQIPGNFINHPKKTIREHLSTALNIYASLHKHIGATEEQKNAAAFLQSAVRELALQRADLQEFTNRAPQISPYHDTTNTQKARQFANTELWKSVILLASEGLNTPKLFSSIRDRINYSEETYNPNFVATEEVAARAAKFEDSAKRTKRNITEQAKAKKARPADQQDITKFFKK